MSAREHCCAFCGSVMRLLLLPAADGSGKRLCCWGCEAAGRMDHVCWTDDSYCRDCGAAAAAELVLEDEPVPAGYAAAGMGEW